ncbi:fasciclin-2-like protein, partial [Leptotrombidium deliense]
VELKFVSNLKWVTPEKKEYSITKIDERHKVDNIYGSLTVQNVTSTDNGTYQCIVNDSGNEVVTEFELILQSMFQTTWNLVNLGASNSLLCDVTTYPDRDIFIYKEGGKELEAGEKFFVRKSIKNNTYTTEGYVQVTIRNVDLEDDGVYVCALRDTSGRILEKIRKRLTVRYSPILTINEPELVTWDNHEITLRCF